MIYADRRNLALTLVLFLLTVLFVTSRSMVAKLRQAWNIIAGNRLRDALFVLAMPVFDREFDDSTQDLEQLVRDNCVGMTECLRPVADLDGVCITEASIDSESEH